MSKGEEGLKRMFTVKKMDTQGNWEDVDCMRIVRIVDPFGRMMEVLADREGRGSTIRMHDSPGHVDTMKIIPIAGNTIRVEPLTEAEAEARA